MPSNNLVIERPEQLEDASIPALLAAVSDAEFPVRGYAGWALSQVIKVRDIENEAAMAALLGAQ